LAHLGTAGRLDGRSLVLHAAILEDVAPVGQLQREQRVLLAQRDAHPSGQISAIRWCISRTTGTTRR
jgi:hypothetical protein